MPPVSVLLHELHKRYKIWFTLSLIRHFQKTNSVDNNGDFRKRCKRVRLENGAEFLLTSEFVY